MPLVSFKLFANHEFTVSLLTGFLIFVTNFFSNVITPFYLENARGFSATHAGYLMMVFPIVQVIIAPLSGSLSDKIGPYFLTLVGLAAILIAQVGYAMWHLASPLWVIIVIIAINGFGNGVFQSPNNTIIMSAVAPEGLRYRWWVECVGAKSRHGGRDLCGDDHLVCRNESYCWTPYVDLSDWS
jgi:MFS family permease